MKCYRSLRLVCLGLTTLRFTWALYSPSNFTPGAVCDGWQRDICRTFPECPGVTVALKNRHLVVSGWPWARPGAIFAEVNAAGKWRGYDKDLMDALAVEAQFTYEIVNSQEWYAPGGLLDPAPANYWDNWNNFMWDATIRSDVVLSYWTDTPHHHTISTLLTHHIVNDWILLTSKNTQHEQPSVVEYTFMVVTPFNAWLWGAIGVALLVNGVSSYWMDARSFEKETRTVRVWEGILKATYLSIGPAFGSETLEPKQGCSKVLNVAWGFLLLVLLSWYTGIVASQLVVAKAVQGGVHSVPDLINQNIPACIHGQDTAGIAAMKELYPNLLFDKVCSTQPLPKACVCSATADDVCNDDTWDLAFTEIQRKLSSGECIAATVPKADPNVLGWLRTRCDLVQIGPVLRTGLESLATNLHSPCVVVGLNWALSRLRETGQLAAIYEKWFGTTTNSCGPRSSEPGLQQVSVAQVCGAFFVYGIAWALASSAHVCCKQPATDKGTGSEHSDQCGEQEMDFYIEQQPGTDEKRESEQLEQEEFSEKLSQEQEIEKLRQVVRAVMQEQDEVIKLKYRHGDNGGSNEPTIFGDTQRMMMTLNAEPPKRGRGCC